MIIAEKGESGRLFPQTVFLAVFLYANKAPVLRLVNQDDRPREGAAGDRDRERPAPGTAWTPIPERRKGNWTVPGLSAGCQVGTGCGGCEVQIAVCPQDGVPVLQAAFQIKP